MTRTQTGRSKLRHWPQSMAVNWKIPALLQLPPGTRSLPMVSPMSLLSGAATHTGTDTQDIIDDDSSDESFHYPGSPTSTARAPSIITQTNDYFTQSRRPSAAPHDLTPQLSQAPEFRVPTHEVPQKVLTPHWTPPTPHSIQTRWEPDDAVSECRGCRRKFTWLLRKHVSLSCPLP